MDRLPEITEDIEIIEKSCVNLERKPLTLVDSDSTIAQQQARDIVLESAIALKGDVLALQETFE